MNGSLKGLWAALTALGPVGMLFITILDTAFLPTAQAVDLLILTQAAAAPGMAPLVGLAAVTGSVIGALLLYFIARSGGGWALRRSFKPEKLAKTRKRLEKYDAAALILPAMLPIPLMPMKVILFVAGAMALSPVRIALAIAFARAVRYSVLILLGVWFGDEAWDLFKANAPLIGVIILALVALFFGLRAWRARRADVSAAEAAASE